jgi:hypothetical protein
MITLASIYRQQASKPEIAMSNLSSRLVRFIGSMLGPVPARGPAGASEVPFNFFSSLMIFGYRRDR